MTEPLRLAMFDLETTGLYADSCDITEVGIVEYDINGRELDRHNWLVAIGYKLPQHIVEITGITDKMLREQGQPWNKVASAAWRVLRECNVWAAYNIDFDIGFLREHLKPVIREYAEPRLIDPIELVKRWLPKNKKGPIKSRSNKAVAEFLGVDLTNAHRATEDAAASGESLFKLLELFEVTLKDYLLGRPLPLGPHLRHEDPFEALYLARPSCYEYQSDF
jgi:DNA polymerase-3 subunit alpha (Gram-positive type)